MQSRIPIINPLDLDSPFIQGMGHDMLEEVENKALKDTNMGTTPIFPMRPGYDSNLIFGIVGKPLPNNLIQWAKAQKGRVPYIVKIGQGIANKAQALAYASIPSISIPEKIDDSIKVGDKIDFQIVDSKPSQPITPSGSGSLLSNIKGIFHFVFTSYFI